MRIFPLHRSVFRCFSSLLEVSRFSGFIEHRREENERRSQKRNEVARAWGKQPTLSSRGPPTRSCRTSTSASPPSSARGFGSSGRSGSSSLWGSPSSCPLLIPLLKNQLPEVKVAFEKYLPFCSLTEANLARCPRMMQSYSHGWTQHNVCKSLKRTPL